jgi:hypothetical protein
MTDLQYGQSRRVKLPRRSSKYRVGKEIAGKVYVHRDYANRLGNVVSEAATRLPAGSEYNVVKYDTRSGTVSFIASPDFDCAEEPTVGDAITVRHDGTTRRRSTSGDPRIYHHKWLFVDDDYSGFDVEASKERSAIWLALDNVDKSRIGTKSYWYKHVVPRLTSSDVDAHARDS